MFQFSENSGQTLFSGQVQVAQKSCMVKHIFNTVKNFRANSIFEGKRKVAQKSWTVNKFSIQCIQCVFTWRWYSTVHGTITVYE